LDSAAPTAPWFFPGCDLNPQAGAAAFTASIPSDAGTRERTDTIGANYNCGGTPTDEAIYWFYDELQRTQIPGRMQMAVLVTDGVPTLCYTNDGRCDGSSQTAGNKERATNAAIAERDNPAKLPQLGSLFMSVGIGTALTTIINPTTYGSVTGRELLTRFASDPKMAFFPQNFTALVTETLGQVLDMLCFYLIDVDSPGRSSCQSSGTTFVIRGYNFFSLGNPKCRWQEVGTQNYLYTDATVTATNFTVPGVPGTVGLITCQAPVVPTDPYNAYLEISRDGTYYTNNQYSVLLRADCSAPIPPRQCPNATVAAVFQACTPADFQTQCSDACKNASGALGQAFAGQGVYLPAFNATQIRDCISSNFPTAAPWTDAVKAVMIARSGPSKGPCVVPPPPALTGGAGCLSISLFLTVCLSLLATRAVQ